MDAILACHESTQRAISATRNTTRATASQHAKTRPETMHWKPSYPRSSIKELAPFPHHVHLFGRCFGVPRKHTARHIDHTEYHARSIQPARKNPARNDACTAEPSLIKVDDCTSKSMKPPPFAAARAPLLAERACSEHAVSAGRARHASMCRAVDHAPGRTARRRRSGLRVTPVSLFTPQNGTLSHQVEGGYPKGFVHTF